MDRLTNKKEADAQRKEYERHIKQGYMRNIPEERYLKLAAYEDTGLTPEQVEQLQESYAETISPDTMQRAHLERIAEKAEKHGGIDHLVALDEAAAEGRLIVLPVKVGDTVWYDTWERGIKNIGVQPHKIDRVDVTFVSEVSEFVRTEIPLWELGKTVFTSREAAEAALKEAQGK